MEEKTKVKKNNKVIIISISVVVLLLVCIVAGVLIYQKNGKEEIFYYDENYGSMLDAFLPTYTATASGNVTKTIITMNSSKPEGNKKLNGSELKEFKDDLNNLQEMLKQDKNNQSYSNTSVRVYGEKYEYASTETKNFLQEIMNKYFANI